MADIIVIRGPLGVGKTTVSKLLAEKFQAEYLSLDKIGSSDFFMSLPDGPHPNPLPNA